MKRYLFKFIRNKDGVSHPLEVVFAFGIIIVSFSLIFMAVSHLFTSYEKDEFVLKSKAKSICERLIQSPGLSKDGSITWEFNPKGIKCLGFASLVLINDTWNIPPPINADYVDIESISVPNSTMLSEIYNLTVTKYSYKVSSSVDPIRVKYAVSNRIDYGVIDYDKIYALNEVNYEDNNIDLYSAKEAIGLEDVYDFNIKISELSTNKDLLTYGRPYENRESVGEFSRNIIVYYSYSTSYIPAKITVYVF